MAIKPSNETRIVKDRVIITVDEYGKLNENIDTCFNKLNDLTKNVKLTEIDVKHIYKCIYEINSCIADLNSKVSQLAEIIKVNLQGDDNL